MLASEVPAAKRGTLAPTLAQPLAVAFEHVCFAFDDHVVLDDVSFAVPHGSLTVLLGASGSGKSVTLKLMLGLLRPDSGSIVVDDHHIERMSEADLLRLRGRIGMLFKESALFDSLSVTENVGYRLFEETGMPRPAVHAASTRCSTSPGWQDWGTGCLGAVGRAAASGGDGAGHRAQAWIAAARQSTSGLNAMTASRLDDEILKLRDLERVTAVVARIKSGTLSTGRASGGRDGRGCASGRRHRPDGAGTLVVSTTGGSISRVAPTCAAPTIRSSGSSCSRRCRRGNSSAHRLRSEA